jgi:hypothetical protein
VDEPVPEATLKVRLKAIPAPAGMSPILWFGLGCSEADFNVWTGAEVLSNVVEIAERCLAVMLLLSPACHCGT